MYIAQNKYGRLPSKRHINDLHYACATPSGLPAIFSYRNRCPGIYDQGQTGSCTGNAGAGVVQLKRILEGKANVVEPSRSFIYYNARKIEGNQGSDAGATIRDAATSIATSGFCPESMLPLDPSTLLLAPSQACYDAAKPTVGGSFLWVGEGLTGAGLLQAIKAAIAAGDPLEVGIDVYESFESANANKTGRIPVPHWWESQLGGHAIEFIGWNDNIKCIEFRNSWGVTWGDHGYGWLPYAYVENTRLTQEFAALASVA